MGFRTLAILGAFAGLIMAADQPAAPGESSVQTAPPAPGDKDFVKPFSAKPFSAPQIMKDMKNARPNQYIEPPSATVRIEKPPKQCSIPLLWAHADSRLDPHSVVPMGPPSSAKSAAPNPAPACRNWGEEIEKPPVKQPFHKQENQQR